MKNNILLRQTFQIARLCHEARPVYPASLFATVVKITALFPTSKLIVIGPGTGQATKSLAMHGYDIKNSQLIYDRYSITDQHRKPSLPKAASIELTEMHEKLFHLVLFQHFRW